jgi:hypothetical protein
MPYDDSMESLNHSFFNRNLIWLFPNDKLLASFHTIDHGNSVTSSTTTT